MPEPNEHTLLSNLSERAGIAAEYYDIAGSKHITSDDTKRTILAAMGFSVQSPADLAVALRQWDEAPWRRGCDSVRVVREGSEISVSCCLAVEDGKEESIILPWKILDETGTLLHEGE